MTIEGFGTNLILAVAQKLVIELGQRGVEALRGGPVDQAIVETQGRFDAIEVDTHLRSWCASEEFGALLQTFVSGAPKHEEVELVDSFLDLTDFFLPEDSRRSVATEVVAVFFQNLYHRLLVSPEGLAIATFRGEALHLQSQAKTDLAISEIREVHAGLNEVRALLDQKGEPPQSTGIEKEIDAARDLLRSGKPATARGLLESIRNSLPADAGSHTWMRVEANLAAASLALDDLDEARTRYQEALRHERDSRALATGAQVELSSGHGEEALELARESWAVEPAAHSAAVLLMSLARGGSADEIEQLIAANGWIESDPACLAALGMIAVEKEELDLASSRLHASLAADPSNARVGTHLAMTLMAIVQRDIAGEPPPPWMMDPTLLAKLDEAENLLTEAAAAFDSQEPRDAHLEAIALRAITRTLSRRNQDAVADAEYVLHERPDHYTANRTKGLALLSTDPESALGALQAAWRASQEEGVVGFTLAHALRRVGRLADAEAQARDLLQQEPPSREQIPLLSLLGELSAERGQEEQALAFEHELLDRWPSDPNALVAAAEIARARGAKDESISRYTAALESATGNLRSQIALEFSDALLASGKFDEASNLLAELVDDSAPLPTRQRYAAALFNAGRLKEALDFARRQRSEDEVVPVISEIEALVLTRIGAIGQARRLYELLGRDQNEAGFKLQAAGLALQEGDPSAARTLIDGITETDVESDAFKLMQLAQLRQAVGLPDALPPAYLARRLAYGEPGIHMAYLTVFLHRSAADSQSLDPKEIGPDVTVTLRNTAEEIVLRIEARDPDRGRGDVSPEDDLAHRLLGAKTGDEIVFRDDGIERLAYHVAELRSKYVEAFQDTLKSFATRFPGRTDLRQISVAEGDFTGMFRLLDRQHSSAVQILELFKTRRAPLGMVAQLLGRDPIDVARALRMQDDLLIPVSTGQAMDNSREFEGAAARAVVMDETAILSTDELQMWDVVDSLFDRVLVPQQIVDALRASISDGLALTPAGFVGKSDAGYFMRDLGPEEIAAEQERRSRILDSITAHTAVTAAEGLLDLGMEKLDELRGMIGAGTLAAIHLARDQRAALWTDDLATRLLARDEWEVDGTWTQPVLRRAKVEGGLEQRRYAESIAAMASWGFLFLIPEPEDLLSLIAAHSGAPNARLVGTLGLVLGRNYAEDFAIPLAARILRGIFLLAITPERRTLMVDLVLTSVTRGREPRKALANLTAELWPLLNLLPLAQADLARAIQLWTRQRGIA